MRNCFLALLAIACGRPAFAQDTTARPTADTARSAIAVQKDTAEAPLPPLPPAHSPRKAAFYSAILPGLGQAYNREYWKIPLVYAAMGISAGFFIYNFDQYKTYRDAYRLRMDGNVNTKDEFDGRYTDRSLQVLRDAYRQYVDYSVLVFILAYGLNIVDATVFAHLKGWNMSDDLSLRITPAVINNQGLGLSLRIGFGKGRQHRSMWVSR